MSYGYLIDPVARTVTEVPYSGDYQQIYTYIEADTFDVARVNEHGDGIFIDDNGLSREGQSFFWISGYPQPLAGRGLYLGCNSEGESVSPHATLDEVKSSIQWISVQALRDVLREEDEPTDPAEAAFKTAFDIMESIRKNKGHKYALVVETALLVRKHTTILASLTDAMVTAGALPEPAAERLLAVHTQISAQLISISADIAGLDKNNESAADVMGWADRLNEYEQRGADEVIKQFVEDRGRK